jgi:hypothetical protein
VTIVRSCVRNILGALALLGSSSLGATDLDANFAGRLLAVHNRERAQHDLPPMRWNASLAESARQWAVYLASSGRFEHAPARGRQAQGENLWAGTKNVYSLEQMVDAWAQERRYFKPGDFPDNSSTGRVSDVGHYTQLVWRDTREVGCAKATGLREDVLVCRYGQPGNFIGEAPF